MQFDLRTREFACAYQDGDVDTARASIPIDTRVFFHMRTSELTPEQLEIFRLLIAHPDTNLSHLLEHSVSAASLDEHAVTYDLVDVIRLLLVDPRLDLTQNRGYMLYFRGDRSCDALRLLLEDGRMDPTADDDQLLYTAIEHDVLRQPRSADAMLGASTSEMMRLLLADPRVTPTYDHLLWAISNANAITFRMLIEDGRALGDRCGGLLEFALESEDDVTEIVQILRQQQGSDAETRL